MITEFYLDLYNRHFILCVGMQKDDVDSILSERLGVPVSLDIEDCLGLTDKIKGKDLTAIVIYLKSGDMQTKNLGTMVHEATHAANFLFDHCGIRADLDNDEPLAYLVDWIFRQIIGAVNG